MDRFLSCGLGRNVRPDAPQEEGRQERFGNIPVVRAHRVSASPVQVMTRIDQVAPASLSDAGHRNDSTLIPKRS